ncbi:hypothetical protein NC653_028569 [Populus alba x Populus x berolinensis]|uniref:Uncharacterized protein n=1 Tax=Populus alba x Populus x berolinensis TaxID=444605 RepID=A0AAD6M035_9ROSI|nr:hypothetical protein NC653_028569 [Populus alba x Populus x berolinensis]
MGGVEIIEREVELLKMMEREERIIGMEGAVKHAAREVQCSDMPGFQQVFGLTDTVHALIRTFFAARLMAAVLGDIDLPLRMH